MASALLGSLPLPKRQLADEEEIVEAPRPVAPAAPKRPLPPYLRRQGFVPRKPEDYGDGGAYPEVHVAQYPLGLGSKDAPGAGGPRAATLPVTVNADGTVDYSALLKQGANAKKQVLTDHTALVPRLESDEAPVVPEDEVAAMVAARTAAAIEARVNSKIAVAQPTQLPPKPKEPEYIRYTPSQQGPGFNSGAGARIIRMVEQQVDPLDPPKFRFKRVPRGPGSPPVPVLHSPPRAVSVQDQADWKIPPCISNWKNAKGYTIPLDKRLAADGRGLQDVTINDSFAKLSESLYVAEQKAREAVETRAKIQKELLAKDKEKKEAELRALAQRARVERGGGGPPGGGLSDRLAAGLGMGMPPPPPPLPGPPPGAPPPSASYLGRGDRERASAAMMAASDDDDGDDDGPGGRPRGGAAPPRESAAERDERLARDELREERRRERERERRLEAADAHGGKKSKLTRDRDRDVSERIALGQANTGAGGRGAGAEAMYDQRLFNQDAGMAAGFAADDGYTLYDKPLFADKGSGLYAPKAVDTEVYGGGGGGGGAGGGGGDGRESDADRLLRTDRFKADKGGFAGAAGGQPGARAPPRTGPVEFERDAAGDDPFGLEQFMDTVKRGKKPLDKIGGTGGTMAAAAGGSADPYDGGSGRTRVNFERERG